MKNYQWYFTDEILRPRENSNEIIVNSNEIAGEHDAYSNIKMDIQSLESAAVRK